MTDQKIYPTSSHSEIWNRGRFERGFLLLNFFYLQVPNLRRSIASRASAARHDSCLSSRKSEQRKAKSSPQNLPRVRHPNAPALFFIARRLATFASQFPDQPPCP